MAKKKEEKELVPVSWVKEFKILPVEFADLNTLKDKINEIVEHLNR